MFEKQNLPESYWDMPRKVDKDIDIIDLGLVECKNILKQSDDLIDKIESLDQKILKNFDKTSLKPWNNWNYGYNNKESKSLCLYKHVPENNHISPKDIFYNEQKEISTMLISSIDNALIKYYDVYPRAEKNIMSKEKFPKLLKYSNGDLMPAHSDHGTTSRTLSLILYLNDNYNGGEVFFPYLNKSIKPASGSVIIFPSNFIYTHEVKAIKSGIRYSFPNWFHNSIKQSMPYSPKHKDAPWENNDI